MLRFDNSLQIEICNVTRRLWAVAPLHQVLSRVRAATVISSPRTCTCRLEPVVTQFDAYIANECQSMPALKYVAKGAKPFDFAEDCQLIPLMR